VVSRLNNTVLAGGPQIRVYCRVRPYSEPDSSVRCLQDGASLAVSVDGKDHTFKFDQVFAPGANQETVFGSVSELIQVRIPPHQPAVCMHACHSTHGHCSQGFTKHHHPPHK
jgi:hypothetical protein